MYIVAKGKFNNGETWYLGWQEPVWDEDGYFWTMKDVINEIIKDNTKEHPFIFNTKQGAINLARMLKIRDYIIEEWT